MKRILVNITLLLLFCNTSFAQQKQTYLEGKDIKKYAGEWVGTNGTDTFRIILKYNEKRQMNPGVFIDAIFGWHSYTQNGIMESNNITSPLNYKDYSIFAIQPNKGKASFSFNDKQKNKGHAQISFTIVPGTNNTKAIWKVERIIPQEGARIVVVDKNGKPLTKNRYGKPIPPPPPLESEYPLSKITAVPEWTMMKVN